MIAVHDDHLSGIGRAGGQRESDQDRPQRGEAAPARRHRPCNKERPSKLRSGSGTPSTLRSVLSSLRRPLIAVLWMAAAVALASCGGSGGNATGALNRAFKHRIQSADLKLQIDLDTKSSTPSQPQRFQVSGPFRANGRKLPSANLTVVSGPPGGQTVTTGFLSTGDRLFVKFQDVYYEQPAAVVRKTNQNLARTNPRASSPTALGLHPRSWLKEAKTNGSAQVGGVGTRHISGKLDVANLARDFNDFLKRSGGAVGSPTGQAYTGALSDADIKKVVQFVKNPSFDVYVGKRDGILRRIAGQIKFQVPSQDQAQFRGLRGGTVQFSMEFDNVNGHQRIVAPAHARPLSELTQLLGGAGPSPTSPTPPGALKKYAQCLDKSKPGDTDALQRCARLLR